MFNHISYNSNGQNGHTYKFHMTRSKHKPHSTLKDIVQISQSIFYKVGNMHETCPNQYNEEDCCCKMRTVTIPTFHIAQAKSGFRKIFKQNITDINPICAGT